ncbi:MAG TPA: PAS domain S-box protein, partial [Bacteroidota bacterium]
MATRVFDLSNYSLTAYALPTFAVAAIIFAVGVLVLFRERVFLVSVSFFLVTIIFSFWLFCFSWIYSAQNESAALWWSKAAYLVIPLAPAAIYQFAAAVLRVYAENKGLLWSLWTPSILFSVVGFSSDALIDGVRQYSWGYYPKYGDLGLPFLVFFLAVLFAALRLYRIEYQKAAQGLHKERIKAFRIAWMVACVAVVDVFPKFGVDVYPFGYIPVLFFVLLSAKAVWRFRLTDRVPVFLPQQIYNTMSDALLVLDTNGIIQVVNSTAEKLFGREEHEMLGKPLSSVLNGALPAEEFQKLREHGKLDYEVNYHTGTLQPRLFSVSASVVRDAEQRLVAIVTTLRDVSERRELSRKVVESQEKYQNIVENSLDGIVVVQDGKLVYVNQAAAKVFEYESPELMKMTDFSDTVAPASKPFVLTDQKPQTIREDVFRNYEMKGITRYGKIVDLEINARLITWNGKPAVQASFRDITDRKMLERDQALWLWEQETLSSIDRKLVSMVGLQRILDTISLNAKALTRADFAGVVMVNNDKSEYNWKSVKGNSTSAHEPTIRLTHDRSGIILSKEPVILNDLLGKHQRDGEHLIVLGAEKIHSAGFFPLVVEGEIRGQLVVGFRSAHAFSDRDVRLLVSLSEKSSIAIANAQLYENLVQSEQELKLLSGARVEAQEEERRRIAREIHDSLGQMLTAIKFNLEILEDRLPLDSTAVKHIDDSKNLLDSAMAEAREISYNLMPSVLEDFGLVPALQLLCDQFSKRRNIKVEYQTHGLAERLEPPLEVTLYRIVQEALNNVSKHAGAGEVSVQVVRHADGVRLTVEDTGKGFNISTYSASVDGRHGMGIVGMRERAASFHGVVNIDSS